MPSCGQCRDVYFPGRTLEIQMESLNQTLTTIHGTLEMAEPAWIMFHLDFHERHMSASVPYLAILMETKWSSEHWDTGTPGRKWRCLFYPGLNMILLCIFSFSVSLLSLCLWSGSVRMFGGKPLPNWWSLIHLKSLAWDFREILMALHFLIHKYGSVRYAPKESPLYASRTTKSRENLEQVPRRRL